MIDKTTPSASFATNMFNMPNNMDSCKQVIENNFPNVIIFPESKASFQTQDIGGKASNLLKLSKVEGIEVPKWFALPTHVFEQFLQENDIVSDIEHLNELCKNYDQNAEAIKLTSTEIQDKIKNGNLSSHHFLSLTMAFNTLINESDLESTCVAVRSSGAMEDAEASSCAGLYETVLNCKGVDEVSKALKRVWASAFAIQVIQERNRLGIKQTDSNMGVVIQQMINSKISGVASSVVLGNNYSGIEIAANYGLGESVVGGEVSVDHFVCHPTYGYILEQTLGGKESCIIPDLKGGVKKKELSLEDRSNFVLTPDQVRQLSSQIVKIQKLYACDVDVEFAFNSQGNLLILQARPLVSTGLEKIHVIDPESAKNHEILSKGLYSIPGVCTGKLVYVNSLDDLASGKIHLTKSDILCAYVTTNVWSQYLANIGGLVTKEGSSSSHSILLAREKRIPCVIGIKEEFAKLVKANGQTVTIDGFNKVIYQGEVSCKEANSSDLQKQFETIKLRSWATLEDVLPHLIHNKMVIEKDGTYWRKTPTYQVLGFQREINLLRFIKIPTLLEKGNIAKVRHQIIDGYTCNEVVPLTDYIGLFNGFSLEKSTAFNKAHKNCLDEFSYLSENFVLESTHWHKYIDAYSRLRAYIWLGGGLRSFAERQVDKIGINLELPAFYLNACSEEIQDKIPEIDIAMQEAIYKLAEKLKDEKLPTNVKELKKEFFEAIVELSKQFRFEHKISLDKPLDLNVVYQRVQQEVKSIVAGGQFHSKKNSAPSTVYLTGTPKLKQWLLVSIENRLLQSDSHHIDAKARLQVQSKLLELGDKLVTRSILKNPWDIFTCSIEQIAGYMDMDL